MICGNDLWKKSLELPTEPKICHGMEFLVYKNQPPTLYCALRESCKRFASQKAIITEEGTSYSYQEFLHLVDDLAEYLKGFLEIHPGDHVGILMYNTIEFCVSFLAVNKLGATAVPLPGKFRKQEILSLISKAKLNLLLCEEDYEDWFDQGEESSVKLLVSRKQNNAYGFSALARKTETFSEPQTDSSSTAILMFTSGTTSRSKGVCLTNDSVMHAIRSYQEVFAVTDKDRTLLAVPIYHITGLVAILGLFLTAGGSIYLHKFFHAQAVVNTMVQEKITFFHASPTVFSMLLQEQEQVPSLPYMRILACGSSNMAKEKILKLHDWMPNMEFRTVYGLTETTSPGTIFPEDAATSPYIGSSGIPIPGLSLKIVDEEGEELPPMQTGEILLQGTNLLASYYDTDISAYQEGWFHTGDLGYINEAGYLFISDRKKDMINRGGEKICSYDVENVIYSMEQVEEAAIVGIPDDLYGEVAAAAIVLRKGQTLTLEQLQDALKNKLARYKIPAALLILPKLPETPSHKIDKKAIKQLFLKKMEEQL